MIAPESEPPRSGPGFQRQLCLTGQLRNAYPVSSHDVQIVIDAGAATVEDLCGAASSIFEGDPACRRVVFAPDADDVDSIEVAERAGFRMVVEVDLPGATVKILVCEPQWVTDGYVELNSVPC